MRFDKAQRDVKLCGQKALVDVDRCAGGRPADKPVLGEVPCVVVERAVARGDIRSEDLLDFGRAGGPVQPGGDQDGDVFRADACVVQAAQQGWKHDAVGRRTRDVADGDGGGGLAFRH
jgi:hypothetical protein